MQRNNATLHLAGIIIEQFAARKRELTPFETRLYEAALRRAGCALFVRGQAKQALDEFDTYLREKREQAEAARAAKEAKAAAKKSDGLQMEMRSA